MTHMIILAGAPESAKLDWTDRVLLPASQVEKSNSNHSPSSDLWSGNAFTAQWRQIACDNLQMRPVLPKLSINNPLKDGVNTDAAEFFAASEFVSQESASSDVSGDESQPSRGSGDSTSEELSEFYDHSFSIHEAIPSSQISFITDYNPGTPTYESHEEMFRQSTGSSGGIIRSPSQRRLSQAPKPRRLSDLAEIPNASSLRAIEPQTMTVNLVVAILSISPPRTVTTGARYGKPHKTEVVELSVGDDTKSGFSITLWLPREMHVNWKDGARAAPEGARSLLRRNLRLLRPRDVVMLQNVALSSYRGKVHGQSLKGDVTKIDLLFRKKINDDDLQGIYSVSALRNATEKDSQVLKVKKVRDWMVECVGEAAAPRERKRSQR